MRSPSISVSNSWTQSCAARMCAAYRFGRLGHSAPMSMLPTSAREFGIPNLFSVVGAMST